MVSTHAYQLIPRLHDTDKMIKTAFKRLKHKALLLRGSSLLIPIVPLMLSAIVGLFQLRPLKLLISLLASACFFYAAKRTFYYYRQIAHTLQEDQALSDIQDSRPQGLIAFSLGILLLSAYLLRQPLMIAIATALGASIYYFHYMHGQALPLHLESQPQPPQDLSHLSPTLQEMIETAQKQCQELLTLCKTYRAQASKEKQALSSKIESAAHKAQLLIQLCAEEADNIRRLRNFFVVQLPEFLSICQTFLQEKQLEQLPLAEFTALLDAANLAFAEQSRALVAHDKLYLASKIDVLRQQLESSHCHD